MQNFILATTILISPAAAFAAGGPSCAVAPSPQEMAVLGGQSQPQPSITLPKPVDPQALAAQCLPSQKSAAAPKPAPSAPAAVLSQPLPNAPAASGAPHALNPSEIAQVPALARIASAGATLTDLGTEHGLRTIFAKKGSAFQVFYLVPDGSAAIGGIMWDASGHDLTRDQVAPIPGVIPTVKIDADHGPQTAANSPGPSGEEDALQLVKEATYGTVGPSSAPHLWMFIDPFCAFSVRAMSQLQPYVQAGKLQLSVIPLSVLDYEDQGRSTPAAKIMVGEPPNQMVADWINGQLTGSPADNAPQLLAHNMAIAGALHLRGTPTMIWENADGTAGRADGIPPDLGAVLASIRS